MARVPLADFRLQLTLALRAMAACATRTALQALDRFEFDQIAPMVAICINLGAKESQLTTITKKRPSSQQPC
ncbi:MAG: hypothetical protein EAZ21_09915 [Betaproteobacteria bacterium]|nr:MAG: hypothetical protein EAZ21_09915 [Betaproteobacteria bacterium]